MPELPEVETTLRGISPHISSKTVSALEVRNSSLRWPVPSELATHITGQKLLSLARRGKYLLLGFKRGTLLIHLGMSGNLRIVPQNTPPEKHDHVDIHFGKRITLRFNDPRRFGCVLWTSEPIDEHALIHHLGPEPLDDEFNAEYLFKRSRKKTQGLKTFIMDSRTVVGVGNIYANEALFKAGLHPTKATGKISLKQCELFVLEIKTVLKQAIAQGGTTLKDFVGGDGKPGYFSQQLCVYGRAGEPCLRCGKALNEKRIAQRSSVYCTQCQK